MFSLCLLHLILIWHFNSGNLFLLQLNLFNRTLSWNGGFRSFLRRWHHYFLDLFNFFVNNRWTWQGYVVIIIVYSWGFWVLIWRWFLKSFDTILKNWWMNFEFDHFINILLRMKNLDLIYFFLSFRLLRLWLFNDNWWLLIGALRIDKDLISCYRLRFRCRSLSLLLLLYLWVLIWVIILEVCTHLWRYWG